jgi:hypothetical protein
MCCGSNRERIARHNAFRDALFVTAQLARAATEPGHALTVAFDRKVGAVADAFRRQGIAFVPLAAESLGGWHEVAVLELDRLATALARHTGQEEGEASRHLFGRLSVLLMRGNAALFSNRIPDHAGPEIDGQM